MIHGAIKIINSTDYASILESILAATDFRSTKKQRKKQTNNKSCISLANHSLVFSNSLSKIRAAGLEILSFCQYVCTDANTC